MMKTVKYTSIMLATLSGLALGSAAFAQDKPSDEALAAIEGTYYGTFFCDGIGEMAMSLVLQDGGAPAGDGKWAMKGVLAFSGTTANPDAATGAFRVNGSASIPVAGYAEVAMEPGEWIRQPENFGASGLEFKVVNGYAIGRPTFDGCVSLSMHRIPQ